MSGLVLEGPVGKVQELLSLPDALLFLGWASSLPKMPKSPGTDFITNRMELTCVES